MLLIFILEFAKELDEPKLNPLPVLDKYKLLVTVVPESLLNSITAPLAAFCTMVSEPLAEPSMCKVALGTVSPIPILLDAS